MNAPIIIIGHEKRDVCISIKYTVYRFHISWMSFQIWFGGFEVFEYGVSGETLLLLLLAAH